MYIQSLLNGKNTVSDVIAKAAIALGSDALSEQEVSTICRWLTHNHLAGTQQSEHGRRFSEVQKKSEAGRWKKLLSPLSLSMNLGNPTPVLCGLLPLFGWLYQPTGWRILVSASLIFAAERMFHGAGLPLALLTGAA